MGLFGEFWSTGIGDPDLKRPQSLVAKSVSVVGDSLADIAVSHNRIVTCNWVG